VKIKNNKIKWIPIENPPSPPRVASPMDTAKGEVDAESFVNSYRDVACYCGAGVTVHTLVAIGECDNGHSVDLTSSSDYVNTSWHLTIEVLPRCDNWGGTSQVLEVEVSSDLPYGEYPEGGIYQAVCHSFNPTIIDCEGVVKWRLTSAIL
jgi:hypothetical protein